MTDPAVLAALTRARAITATCRILSRRTRDRAAEALAARCLPCTGQVDVGPCTCTRPCGQPRCRPPG